MPSSRIPVSAGNWKMNTTLSEGRALGQDLLSAIGAEPGAEVVVFPPFTHLGALSALLSGSPIGLGAQNLYWEPKGAFTGEISPAMIAELARYVLIGHSERRQYFGETDATVNRRLGAAIEADLLPVLCIGESLEQRDAGQVEHVLAGQIAGALDQRRLPAGAMIAYEPVWAIGTGRAADAQQAQAAMAFIRARVGALLGSEAAGAMRLLYGGSVTAANVAEYVDQPDVDGALVGGASLNAASFAQITSAIAGSRRA